MCLCGGDQFCPQKYGLGRGSNIGYRGVGPLLGDWRESPRAEWETGPPWEHNWVMVVMVWKVVEMEVLRRREDTS